MQDKFGFCPTKGLVVGSGEFGILGENQGQSLMCMELVLINDVFYKKFGIVIVAVNSNPRLLQQ